MAEPKASSASLDMETESCPPSSSSAPSIPNIDKKSSMESSSSDEQSQQQPADSNDSIGDEDEQEDSDDYQVDVIPPEKKLQRPKRLSIPELLAIRQEYGVSALSLPPFARPRSLTTTALSSKIAWNPSRLQNMILTVGPGTPAAIVDLTVDPSPPAAAAAAACQGGDDDDDDDSSSSDSSEDGSSDESQSEEEEDEEVVVEAMNSPTTSTNSNNSGNTVPAVRRPPSESSASSTSTSPKRTLSDRMKMPDDSEATSPKQQQTQPQQHDMNLDTTSSSDEDNNDNDHSDDDGSQGKDRAPEKRQKNNDAEEEMLGYSDIEKEILEQTEKKKSTEKAASDNEEEDQAGSDKNSAKEEEDNDGEEEELLEELTDRERFYLEVNQAEGNKMQFSEESEEEDNDEEGQDEVEIHPQRRRFERRAESNDENEADNDDDDDDQEMADFREMAAEFFALEQAAEEDDDESDDDDDSDDDLAAARIMIRRRILRRSPSPSRSNRNNNAQKTMKPALRHGGCINTAAWMQAGWRLSTVSSHHFSTSYNSNYFVDADVGPAAIHAMLSDDCPTQLVTSGDDRLVKFWDVRYAMGSANPLPWGRNTHNPFAYTPDEDGPGYKSRWRDFYCKQKPVEAWKIFGNVAPLATLNTGHRGNVFHVTPLWQQPGKVATCGADGYLRLGDVEASSSCDANSSSIIISPEYYEDGTDHMISGFFSLRPGMCFSHHFLNSNVGLLCSERGLRKFDIRLPPRQQERRAVLGGTTTCKACAVWTVSSASSVEEVDSTYVFVGGTSAEVALCDLRMTGGDSSENARIVCQYRPKGLEDNEEVSVSGLDLSRDKKELLVSYESDQIYTFPIFPNAKSAAGPTLEEIDGVERNENSDEDDDKGMTNGCMSMLTNGREERHRSGEDIYHNELASYGGHLNRFTFLKNAKYAGPNDEYICTGSDSGHAWIYERSTGAVVSLLNADNSTCNGVVPHPTLPFFITYGIDSTAKLWRATGPVDPNTDDSPSGRARSFQSRPYEMSSLTRDWDTIEHEIANIEQELAEADAAREDDDEEDNDNTGERETSLSQSYNFLPDQVLSRKELINTGGLGRSFLRYTPGGAAGSRIGNDLHNLPEVLRKNQYECIRAAIGGGVGRRSDPPVESDLKELMRRVSLIRLRHQADRQGISGHWNPNLPWIMEAPQRQDEMAVEPEEDDVETAGDKKPPAGTHPADLVPDNPSDWIPYDPEMSKGPRPCGMRFNCEDYGNFYRESYLYSDKDDLCGNNETGAELLLSGISWRRNAPETEDASGTSASSASENAFRILHETARVLKDGGNEALRKGDMDIAARRYDKAIRYCSVAFMSHNAASTYGGKYEDELMLISMKMIELDIDSDYTVTPLMLKWSPLLKVLISTRLNLSMLLLKQARHRKEVPQLEQALDQARHALRELQPFCTQRGKICVSYLKSGSGGRLCTTGCLTSCGKAKAKTEVLKSNEPEDTYKESKMLEAKAYFRLGSAQSDMGDYGEALKSFDKSVECTLELNPDAKLDPLVVRRLAEAKREKTRQNKRQRKKFRLMFAQDEDKSQEHKATTRHKENTRRRTTAVPIVSPATPGSSARAAAEDRGTQSE